jgi:hypothetical protein
VIVAIDKGLQNASIDLNASSLKRGAAFVRAFHEGSGVYSLVAKAEDNASGELEAKRARSVLITLLTEKAARFMSRVMQSHMKVFRTDMLSRRKVLL